MEEPKKKLKIPVRGIKRLKWGVAGCGNFLENSFLPSLQQVKRSRLISVYSSNINRAKYIAEKFSAKSYYSEYHNFLASDIGAVYIASKNSDHYWQVCEAAKAGKHILCEKPLALTFKEAEEMVKTCNDNHVFLAVNYVYRFHPLAKKVKELIDKQMFGKIVSISTNFNIDLPPNDNYRFNKDQGGGALRDLGTHMIDLLRFFGGEIIEINGNMDNIIYKTDVDDFANAIVKFEKSGYGYFSVSFNTKKQFNRIEILGQKGALSLDNMVGRRNTASKLTIELSGEAKKAFRKRANKLVLMLRSVQKSFLNNETPEVTGTDGMINVKLMEELVNKCL